MMLPAGVHLVHIRHGETDWNVEGRLQGQLDIPVNSRGRAQAAGNAQRLAAWMARTGRTPADFRYAASPLGRARQTLSIVTERLGHAPAVALDERLKEVDFGDWSGWTYDELRAAGADGLVRARKRDKWAFRPPGGESYAALADRVEDWLATVRSDTVVVAHGGVFRVIQGHLCGTPWHEVPELPAPQDKFAVFVDGRIEYL
jgi:probable phosphoglycerate mutase